ncbi:MAG: hypothetical protein KJ072_27165 [Verrucomicrobia bacterium]|nr:hypothetical protein [Verrucomicrobiota bacterium]
MKLQVTRMILVLLLGGSGMVWVRSTASAADPGIDRVTLTVDAADVPRPALRYSLFQNVYDQVPGNAAVAYPRATRLMIQNKDWDQHAEQCSEWLGTPLEQLPIDEVTAVVDAHRAALDQLMKATRFERCDWEIPVRAEGVAALLPHLSEMRAAARLLALDLRLCIRQGRFDDAIERLRAGLTLARHVGDGMLLIEGLVGVAISHQFLGTIEDFVRQPDAPNLFWALTDLPSSYLSVWRATQWERSFLYVHFPVLRELGTRPITATDLQRAVMDFNRMGDFSPVRTDWSEDQASLAVAGFGWLVYPLAREGLAREGMPAGQLDELSAADVLLRYLGGGYARQRDNMFKWFAVPYPEARKGLAESLADFEKAITRDPIEHTLSRLLLPALGKAADRFAGLDRQFAILRCVEAIRAHAARHGVQLPDSLDAIDGLPVPRDPMTGLPFEYRVEGETGTLRAPTVGQLTPGKAKVYEITIRR